MNKLLLFAVIALFSLLMIGAGGGTMSSKLDERQDQREQLSKVVAEMLSEIPIQHREEWLKVAKDNPEILLQINTNNFSFRPSSSH